MKEKLLHYAQTTKAYIVQRNETFIGIGVIIGLLAIIGIIALVMRAAGPNVVYQPAKACDLLTPAEAQQLLGEKVISVDTKDPVISGDTATSKCSYTDSNADETSMMIAAIAVRTGINDKGVQQNKDDFAAAKANNGGDIVTGIGSSAYFNKTSGQLNVLDGHNWLIINYGLASSPQSNTIDKAVELARKVL